MNLTIRNVSSSDFGTYTCVAKNSLGETDGTIKLEGNKQTSSTKWLFWKKICFTEIIPLPTTKPKTETTTPALTVRSKLNPNKSGNLMLSSKCQESFPFGSMLRRNETGLLALRSLGAAWNKLANFHCGRSSNVYQT